MSTGAPTPKRSVLTIAAAAVVAVVVICVLAAVVLRMTADSDDAAAPTPTPTVPAHPSTGPTAPTDTDPALQGLAAPIVDRLGRRVDVPKWRGGWALPQVPVDHDPYMAGSRVAAPSGMMWQRVGDGAIVPFSTSDGPDYVEGLRAFGFEQTPQGAALAGWQITMRIGAANNDTARRIYDTQVLMTDAQRVELYAGLDAEGPYYRSATDALLTYQTQADAFRVDSYADDLAVIEYASPAVPADDGTRQWLTTRIAVAWDGGDWKVQLPENLTDPTGTVSTLDGWTTW